MSNSNYNYAIERYLAERGGEADKNIVRTCGNCCAYDSVIAICNRDRDDEPEDTIEDTQQGCWYHMTHDEQKRLEELVKQRQDEADRLRLAEQRRNGTGECEGCPFRKMAAVLEKLLEECAPDEHRNTRYPSDKLLEEARQALKEVK